MASVLFFGPLSDLSPPREMVLPPGVGTVAQLSAHLAKTEPTLGAAIARAGISVAVNRVLATPRTAIGDDDEISFMSPMSGG